MLYRCVDPKGWFYKNGRQGIHHYYIVGDALSQTSAYLRAKKDKRKRKCPKGRSVCHCDKALVHDVVR